MSCMLNAAVPKATALGEAAPGIAELDLGKVMRRTFRIARFLLPQSHEIQAECDHGGALNHLDQPLRTEVVQ